MREAGGLLGLRAHLGAFQALALFPRSSKPGMYPLLDHGALEFGEHPHHLEQRLAGGRRGSRTLRRSARRRHGRVTRSRPRCPAAPRGVVRAVPGAWRPILCGGRVRRSDSGLVAAASRSAGAGLGWAGRLGTPPWGHLGFGGPAPIFPRTKGVSATPIACPIAVTGHFKSMACDRGGAGEMVASRCPMSSGRACLDGLVTACSYTSVKD